MDGVRTEMKLISSKDIFNSYSKVSIYCTVKIEEEEEEWANGEEEAEEKRKITL